MKKHRHAIYQSKEKKFTFPEVLDEEIHFYQKRVLEVSMITERANLSRSKWWPYKAFYVLRRLASYICTHLKVIYIDS